MKHKEHGHGQVHHEHDYGHEERREHHGHHHEHDHDCECESCGHEHDHEHVHYDHHTHDVYREDEISSITCTVEKDIHPETPVEPSAIADLCTDKIRDFAAWLDEKSYVIGHLKMMITAGAGKSNGGAGLSEAIDRKGELWLSCTGSSITTTASEAWKNLEHVDAYHVGFTAIVLGGDEAELAEKINVVFDPEKHR